VTDAAGGENRSTGTERETRADGQEKKTKRQREEEGEKWADASTSRLRIKKS
jgi:hypothetical protein